MIPQRGDTTQQLLAVSWLVLSLTAVGVERYATQTLPTECIVAFSRITVGNEPRDEQWPDEATFDRAYLQAQEVGGCERPRKRWEEWLD